MEHKLLGLPGKFTPGCPRQPSSPPALKLGMQMKQILLGSFAMLQGWGGREGPGQSVMKLLCLVAKQKMASRACHAHPLSQNSANRKGKNCFWEFQVWICASVCTLSEMSFMWSTKKQLMCLGTNLPIRCQWNGIY
eukprot:353518-Pelagomonas_calceolata.AAC.3